MASLDFFFIMVIAPSMNVEYILISSVSYSYKNLILETEWWAW
jgi:hypothetical protein